MIYSNITTIEELKVLYAIRTTLRIKTLERNKVLHQSWCRFIEISHANPGKMYDLIKTYKVGNPARVITSRCGTTIENLSVFVESLYIQKF